ncbi:CD82 antigen-like [Ruditapes philippinarum]|uniref:CD82 antigen-like n=1 Tax=Ruditapes philippinarum TaxID=129788 RepID=UPI00295B5E08|nr:CD82 antigen-like [Ruditapes philippinarum]XP_060603797.1 CD82 antigen-like [Ruditapes philippinarum]XP_060603798.1 CD82 antigen-like [Ruditapes philippinarum]XP_060603799.1 CD82 antigen-like [Ruditapes philippinarum]
MAEGKVASCSRYILIILNLIFLITGILLLGMGIWIVASDKAMDTVKEKFHLTVNVGTLLSIGYAIIGVGSFMFLVGFCGCCGAIRESAIMIGVYIIFMVVLLCGELAATVYTALEKSSIETKIRQQLLSDVENYNNKSNLDFVQAKFECCGADNYTNYRNSIYFTSDDSMTTFVPDSCCKSDGNKGPVDREACQSAAKSGLPNDNLFTTGCFNIIKGLIEDNSAILIGITAGIIVIELLGIVFAVFLCRNRTDYDYYDD